MEDYSEIRKYYIDGESQRQIAKDLGISRATVQSRGMLESTRVTDEVVKCIEACLEEDENIICPLCRHRLYTSYESCANTPHAK